MKKTKEPKERRNLSSKEFTKLFIKNILINAIFVGIVLGVVYAIGKEILPNVVTTILSFVLIFVGIIKIYLSAITEAFCEGKIYQSDVNKIAKNIVISLIVLLIVNLGVDYLSYLNSLRFFKLLGMEAVALRNLIINGGINIVMYMIIAISCRKKFLKECENQENIIEM